MTTHAKNKNQADRVLPYELANNKSIDSNNEEEASSIASPKGMIQKEHNV